MNLKKKKKKKKVDIPSECKNKKNNEKQSSLDKHFFF